uniref:Uncharacterized protein n=1 Tax=Brassica oleracea TaxID=3712 RepID=A0A3P6E8K1_BRAOL|nr:unnamed protein product [Brassica oleracea]
MVSFLSQKETVVMAPLPLATPTTGRILCLAVTSVSYERYINWTLVLYLG